MSSRLEDFREKSPSPLNNVYVAKTRLSRFSGRVKKLFLSPLACGRSHFFVQFIEMTIVNWEKGRTKPIKQSLERLEKILRDLPSS